MRVAHDKKILGQILELVGGIDTGDLPESNVVRLSRNLYTAARRGRDGLRGQPQAANRTYNFYASR